MTLCFYIVVILVKLRLKVGPKGQIVLPKVVREKLGVKPRSYVTVDFREDELVIRRGVGVEELLKRLEASRKPIAKELSRFSLEDEALEALS